MKTGELISGKIEKLAFGGKGMMKHENFVIFVPFTAVGDEILCRITKLKKNYGLAEIVKFFHKSKFRIDPTCPHFSTCGGCQLQHLSYSQELMEKEHWILDSLERIGGLKNSSLKPVVPSPKEYSYRNHITLTLKKSEEHKKKFLGFYKADNKTLFKVNECPIFFDISSEQQKIMTSLQEFVEKLEIQENLGKVTLFKKNKTKENKITYLLHFDFKTLPKNIESITNHFLSLNPIFTGVVISSKNKKLQFGKTISKILIDDIEFSYSTSVFMQNNREQSLNIIQFIKKLVEEDKPKEILDLYCGIGIYSLLFARMGIDVTGIEFNPHSIKMAIQNGKDNHIEKAKFIMGAVEELIEGINIPDFVILNPPREGLDKKVIGVLRKSLPKKIVYISCMPTTLARDLHLLNLQKENSNENYKVEECMPFDMFPKTTHVETVVVLSRN